MNPGLSTSIRWTRVRAPVRPCGADGRDVNAEKGLYAHVLARAKEWLLDGKTSGFRSSKVVIERAYNNIDVDRNGEISMREMRRFLKKQGMDSKSIKALIKKLDANGDGRISRDEFVAGFGDFVTGAIHLPKKETKKRGWLWW